MMKRMYRSQKNYAICASLYGAARAVAYTRDRNQELLHTEMVAGTIVSAVVHVMYTPVAVFEDAIAIERWARDMPAPQKSVPFPLNVCFPHRTGRDA